MGEKLEYEGNNYSKASAKDQEDRNKLIGGWKYKDKWIYFYSDGTYGGDGHWRLKDKTLLTWSYSYGLERVEFNGTTLNIGGRIYRKEDDPANKLIGSWICGNGSSTSQYYLSFYEDNSGIYGHFEDYSQKWEKALSWQLDGNRVTIRLSGGNTVTTATFDGSSIQYDDKSFTRMQY